MVAAFAIGINGRTGVSVTSGGKIIFDEYDSIINKINIFVF